MSQGELEYRSMRAGEAYMTARDLKTLIADDETPETIGSALEALDEIIPTAPAKALAELKTMREELMREFQTLSPQGILF